MCLDAGYRSIEPSSLVQSSFKLFDGSAAVPKFQVMPLADKLEVPLDKWLTAEGGTSYYPAGFHIYIDETEFTLKNKLRRVYFRNAHTRGSQDKKTIVVAREMYVPSNPDAWPPR